MDTESEIVQLKRERDDIGKEIGKICRNIDSEKKHIKSLRKKEKEIISKIEILKYNKNEG